MKEPLNSLSPPWANKRPVMTERQPRLWHALNDYIHKCGAWLVIAPHEKWLLVEVPQNSSLPVKFREFGYDAQSGGASTRLTSPGINPEIPIARTVWRMISPRRELPFPGDRRRLMDMRRSGVVEAIAGNAGPLPLSAKLANSI